MKTTTTIMLLVVLALSSGAEAQDGKGNKVTPVSVILKLAIDRGVPLYNSRQYKACDAVYEVAATSLLALGRDTLDGSSRKTLEKAIERHAEVTNPGERAWVLRRAFDEILGDDGFRVKLEAELPAGFPAPGPVGQVVEKDYPRYRLARADGGSAFWTLFQHIKKNDIEMTAPVEMTMTEKEGALYRQNMAFLYERPDQGRSGTDGAVKVIDGKPVKVLSIGLRGPLSDAKMREARAEIEKLVGSGRAWIKAGDWRLLGYNSPMVMPTQRFYEIQLPVRKADSRTP